ncbi:hypothetical protein, partial [Acetanaerobacterium elongatum]|uniref:hypothetical protein n=1 Tax=Acetanaerobacterium elongatum TaxID=258515 RepID=UPI00196745E6
MAPAGVLSFVENGLNRSANTTATFEPLMGIALQKPTPNPLPRRGVSVFLGFLRGRGRNVRGLRP